MDQTKIAGALYDLLGYLTTREEPLTLGRYAHAPPVLGALAEWAKSRNLNIDDADVLHWNDEEGKV